MGEENDDEIPDLFSGIEDSDGSLSSESALKPVDRARGILSPTDRDYLCGLKDYSHSQTELNRRQEIRERTIEGIRDFNLLWLLLEEPEWKKVIEAFEPEELNTALSSMIAFAYTAIGQDTSRMEDILERALYEGANYDISGRWSGKANDATVDIDIDYEPNVEELYIRVQQGEGDTLTPAEIGALVQAGKLDPEDLEKLETTGPDFPGVYAGGAIKRTDENDTEE